MEQVAKFALTVDRGCPILAAKMQNQDKRLRINSGIISKVPRIRSLRKWSAPKEWYWLPITAPKIRAAAQKIAREVDPEKIILFGSYAYGKPTIDSDVDLFIVMESSERWTKRHIRVSEVLSPRPFPVDIIVRTPLEVRERLQMKDCFIEEIMAKGIVLYERQTNRRMD